MEVHKVMAGLVEEEVLVVIEQDQTIQYLNKVIQLLSVVAVE